MNYDEYDAGAQAVDWQESHDEAAACAQMEQDHGSYEVRLRNLKSLQRYSLILL